MSKKDLSKRYITIEKGREVWVGDNPGDPGAAVLMFGLILVAEMTRRFGKPGDDYGNLEVWIEPDEEKYIGFDVLTGGVIDPDTGNKELLVAGFGFTIEEWEEHGPPKEHVRYRPRGVNLQ